MLIQTVDVDHLFYPPHPLSRYIYHIFLLFLFPSLMMKEEKKRSLSRFISTMFPCHMKKAELVFITNVGHHEGAPLQERERAKVDKEGLMNIALGSIQVSSLSTLAGTKETREREREPKLTTLREFIRRPDRII